MAVAVPPLRGADRTRSGVLLLLLLPLLLWACATPVAPGPAPVAPPVQPVAVAPPTDKAPAAAAPPGSAAPAKAASTDAPETTRRWARAGTQWLARGVDSWFGSQPFDDGGKVTDGKLSLGVYKRQDQTTDVDLRFNAHFHLPNVQRQAYLFIGRDDRRAVVRDAPDARIRQQQLLLPRRTEPSVLAGLGLRLRDMFDFRLGLGSGARPYAQIRYDLPWVLAPGHLLDFRETVFWTRADRWGSTTVLSYDLSVSPTLALRWLNVATITQETRNLEWSSSLGAYKLFGQQRLLSLEALFSGAGTRGTGVGQSDRGLLLKWEQPVHKTWLLAEIVAGHFWPRPDADSERGQAWALGGSLKLRF